MVEGKWKQMYCLSLVVNRGTEKQQGVGCRRSNYINITGSWKTCVIIDDATRM